MFQCSSVINRSLFGFVVVFKIVDIEEAVDLETPNEIYFTAGQRGCRLLHVDGYKFVKNRKGPYKTYWICAKKGSTSCKARVITPANSEDKKIPQLIARSGKHNHPIHVERRPRNSTTHKILLFEDPYDVPIGE